MYCLVRMRKATPSRSLAVALAFNCWCRLRTAAVWGGGDGVGVRDGFKADVRSILSPGWLH